MAKVISTHEMELRPGVTAEEFERFARQVDSWGLPGWKCYFVKGSRGARVGHYDVIMEFASVERRDELYPAEGTMNEEVRQYMESAAGQELLQRWGRLASGPGEPEGSYTDYEVLGE